MMPVALLQSGCVMVVAGMAGVVDPELITTVVIGEVHPLILTVMG